MALGISLRFSSLLGIQVAAMIHGSPIPVRRVASRWLYLFLPNPNPAPALSSNLSSRTRRSGRPRAPSEKWHFFPSHKDVSIRSNVICQTRKVTTHMFDKCAWVVQDRIGIRTTAPSTLSLPVALGSGVLYLHPRPGPSAPHRAVACLHDLTVPELPHKLPMTVEE